VSTREAVSAPRRAAAIPCSAAPTSATSRVRELAGRGVIAAVPAERAKKEAATEGFDATPLPPVTDGDWLPPPRRQQRPAAPHRARKPPSEFRAWNCPEPAELHHALTPGMTDPTPRRSAPPTAATQPHT
jgi:hypothetical protein